MQGPRNSGFNGFIWTHGFLEDFEFNLLLFTEQRVQGSELLIFWDFQELWTHQLKSIVRALEYEILDLDIFNLKGFNLFCN